MTLKEELARYYKLHPIVKSTKGKKVTKKKKVNNKSPKKVEVLECFYTKMANSVVPSVAEDRIRSVLNNYNFIFYCEISFKECRSSKYGHYRFDFYLPELRLIIEYDGGHHLLAKYKRRDKIKDNFCKINGLTIKRYNKIHWENLEVEIIRLLSTYKLPG